MPFRLQILVAEDNRDCALSVASLLRLCGHQRVQVVSDGPSALAAVETGEIDVVLLDLQSHPWCRPGNLCGRRRTAVDGTGLETLANLFPAVSLSNSNRTCRTSSSLTRMPCCAKT